MRISWWGQDELLRPVRPRCVRRRRDVFGRTWLLLATPAGGVAEFGPLGRGPRPTHDTIVTAGLAERGAVISSGDGEPVLVVTRPFSRRRLNAGDAVTVHDPVRQLRAPALILDVDDTQLMIAVDALHVREDPPAPAGSRRAPGAWLGYRAGSRDAA